MKTILFIDGRNFLGKLSDVFKSENAPVPDWWGFNFRGLFDAVLTGISRDQEIFYFARIKEHEQTKEKSKRLIENQRLLKTHLESQKFQVILAGTVRGNTTKDIRGRDTLVFKEKGVDVSIAVDMVVSAYSKELKTAILASSDSDLQPAIRALTQKEIETVYLGFETTPNKGLVATAKRAVLIRNSEVLSFRGNLPI